MNASPFSIFAPFENRLRVTMLTKKDAVAGDADLARILQNDRIVSLRQIHRNRTVTLRKPSRREQEADGIVSDAANLWLAVRTADCQPIVAYVPSQNIAGVLHVGWKGLVNGAIPAFFAHLHKEWNVEPTEALVAIGPSLCKACARFTDPRKELLGINSRFFHGHFADLPAIADDQLLAAGVLPGHIERHPDCTQCLHNLYWSYRGGDREAVQQGHANVLACMLP